MIRLMFLTYAAAHTKKIALGTASIVTPLRHPLHLAKAAATLDSLSHQRFLFGAATGDRPIEFPAFKVDPNDKEALFRESIEVMRQVWRESFPKIQTEQVELTVGDVVPKPEQGDIPIFGTGYSGQTIEWLANIQMAGYFTRKVSMNNVNLLKNGMKQQADLNHLRNPSHSTYQQIPMRHQSR